MTFWVFGTTEVLVCVAAGLLLLYKTSAKKATGAGGEKPPPGPWGVPILGYLPFMGLDATATFNKLRKIYGDLFTISMGSHRAVVVNGLDNIREMMHSELVSDRPQLKSFSCINEGRSVSFMRYGPAYKLHRKICIKALSELVSPDRGPLQKMLHDSGEILCKMFKPGYMSGKAIDPSLAVQTALMSVVFKICFGPDLSPEGSEDFQIMREQLSKFDEATKWCSLGDIVTALQGVLRGKYEHFRQINVRYTEAIQRRVTQHTRTYQEGVQRDGMDALIYCMSLYREKLEKLGLTERDILHSVQDFVGAGTENSTNSVLWIIEFLAKYPEAQRDVYEEIAALVNRKGVPISPEDRKQLPLTRSFIMEVSRVRHSAPIGIPRAAGNDFVYQGHYVSKGTMIIGNLNSVFMDETLFEEPEVFKPRRFLKADGTLNHQRVEKLPIYGLGKRRCLGQSLAQNELFYFTAVIVQNFRLIEDSENPLPITGHLKLTLIPDTFKVLIEKRAT